MDLGLLQRDVAAIIGVSKAALLMWEKGRSRPEVHFWPAIISFLGYKPWEQPESLPERVLAFRRTRGWTQAQLAADLGTVLSSWRAIAEVRHNM